ncbi:hypothetical protein EH240_33460 [Mesorhizobium tamadayense]|uniref:Uncharacterized protein n=1 Tax=Mesorhizobium tamadayense TaxID=425306 RepID=A0A3P3EUP1_9HYPH|nr:hypothetical protein [Mesorhizobium tamadayense]RRH90110.1 hypothetical protein EH240_33460 [Mesorhizobium tamadayense]
MARSEAEEPKLSAGAFEQRSKALAVQLARTLDLATGEVSLPCEIASLQAALSLGGRASEIIARNRGKPHRVIPLCGIANDVLAWIGYREHWHREGGEQSFRFIECGFTLHVGREGELEKPQILRSEWIGRRSGMFGNNAGHPHWQLDVLESARQAVVEPPRFAEAAPAAPVEFGSAAAEEPFGESLLFGLTVERMHLASAALWWRKPSLPVAHPPESVADLDRWILGCVNYLRQEIRRCVIVGVPSYLAT